METLRESLSVSTLLPALLDAREAQAYLGGISLSMLGAIVRQGQLPTTKIGRRTLFSRAALDDYIKSHTNTHDSAA